VERFASQSAGELKASNSHAGGRSACVAIRERATPLIWLTQLARAAGCFCSCTGPLRSYGDRARVKEPWHSAGQGRARNQLHSGAACAQHGAQVDRTSAGQRAGVQPGLHPLPVCACTQAPRSLCPAVHIICHFKPGV